MSEKEKGHVDCPFSGLDETLVNVRFFRGRRDDVISSGEIMEQARSAVLQCKLGTALVSPEAPRSPHPSVDIKEIVANL